MTAVSKGSSLLGDMHAGLAPLAERLAHYDSTLAQAAEQGRGQSGTEARRLRKKIKGFEPSVTMIGQVKAGKTTLVNAMTGWPGLLPADVNPWTSVVTSLHMTPARALAAGRAEFRFFTEDEWSGLLRKGGRVGELARRAGAEDELDKVRQQLDEMRAKSRVRLGQNFELLLGQSHDYDCFDGSLIERYVCLGDHFWEDTGESREQGRFADITRSADLWLDQPTLPLRLCIRDTPGVNDTFMIREQITINALRGSRLCVMVLSAQQALTAVDLALIRLISNVKSRDLVIFVNRIDELADPATEVPEIRASIVETLRRNDGPADAEIIFGSGLWAGHTVGKDLAGLAADSAKALLNWAESELGSAVPQPSTEAMIWQLSGMPALGRAIAARIEAGLGAQLEQEVKVALGNLERGQTAADRRPAGPSPGAPCKITAPEMQAALKQIEQRGFARFDAAIAELRAGFGTRMAKARDTFLSRATSALVKHLESYGELDVWSYDPCGFRMLLRSAYGVHTRNLSRMMQSCLEQTAADLNALYGKAFDLPEGQQTLETPPSPRPEPPVVLGQMIALDLKGTWWARFWRRRRGYDAFAQDFAHLIREETQPIVTALVNDNATVFEQSLRMTLTEFLDSQKAMLTELAQDAPHGASPSGRSRAKMAGARAPNDGHNRSDGQHPMGEAPSPAPGGACSGRASIGVAPAETPVGMTGTGVSRASRSAAASPHVPSATKPSATGHGAAQGLETPE